MKRKYVLLFNWIIYRLTYGKIPLTLKEYAKLCKVQDYFLSVLYWYVFAWLIVGILSSV